MIDAQPGSAPGLDVSIALIAHSHEAMAIVETGGTMRYVSPAFAHVLGYAPAELLGASAFAYVHPDDVDRAHAAFLALAAADAACCRQALGSDRAA